MRDVIQSICDRDPAAPHWMDVVLSYPGFHVLGFYRLAHFFYGDMIGAFLRGLYLMSGGC